MTPSGNCFAMTATEPADSSRDRRRTGRLATKKTVARPWNRLRSPLRRPKPYWPFRFRRGTVRSGRPVPRQTAIQATLAERVDKAGLHFDAVADRTEEFSVTTIPEAAVRRECDLRAPRRAEGVIGESEALAA